jgi:hypothetical protein
MHVDYDKVAFRDYAFDLHAGLGDTLEHVLAELRCAVREYLVAVLLGRSLRAGG